MDTGGSFVALCGVGMFPRGFNSGRAGGIDRGVDEETRRSRAGKCIAEKTGFRAWWTPVAATLGIVVTIAMQLVMLRVARRAEDRKDDESWIAEAAPARAFPATRRRRAQ